MSEIKQISLENQEFSKADFLDVLEENPFPCFASFYRFFAFLDLWPLPCIQSQQWQVKSLSSFKSLLPLPSSHLFGPTVLPPSFTFKGSYDYIGAFLGDLCR